MEHTRVGVHTRRPSTAMRLIAQETPTDDVRTLHSWSRGYAADLRERFVQRDRSPLHVLSAARVRGWPHLLDGVVTARGGMGAM